MSIKLIQLLLCLCWGMFFFPYESFGQKVNIDPELLQEAIDQPEKEFHLGIVLEDRLDVFGLYQKWKKTKPGLAFRNRYLIHQLKTKARQSQQGILVLLNDMEGIRQLRGYWIANTIFFKAKGATLPQLANLDGVESLFEAGHIQNDGLELEEAEEVLAPAGRESGLSVIGAPAMWRRGYTGFGTKVLNIDSGIFDEHPAFSARYWGNRVDKSQAWFDPTFRHFEPDFCDWHGTHTLGTILGLDPATEDTIGVAFDAFWMAANATCPDRTTQDIIETFQWAIDPDGDSTTLADVPDVINNSWTDATLSNECQNSLYQDVFTALEASGVALVFSAGNTGPSNSSIPPPKNINLDEVNTFTVGIINGNSPQLNLIAFSSRGPSDCPASGSLAIKPEVVAPGFQVRSAHIDGGYRSRSGTSMAAPHASGALLLLKQAFPDLPGYELKQALYQSSTDLGVSGEDNDYGRGLINLEAAYQYLTDNGNIPFPAANAYDLTLDSVLNLPVSICDDTLRPQIALSNSGTGTITQFMLNYQLDGVSRATSWVGSLGPGQQLLLSLASFYVPMGAHTFEVEVKLDSGQQEYLTFDNKLQSTFFTYPPDLPLAKNFVFCKGADGALFAQANELGEIYWFGSNEEILGKGKRLWLGKVEEAGMLELAIFPEDRVGPSFPVQEQQFYSNDSLFFLQFDARQSFVLNGFRIKTLGSALQTFVLKDQNDQILEEKSIVVVNGTNFIELNWDVPPGKDYLLMVRTPISLARQEEGVSYPLEVNGILRLNGAGGGINAFNYFYDWKISYELPCSRKEIPIRIAKGNMKAIFSIEKQESYFFRSDSLEFTDLSDKANSWYWDFGDGTISKKQNPAHLYQDSGKYVVFQVVNGKENCADAHRDTVLFVPSGTNSIPPSLQNGWKIYPNPSSGAFFIEKPGGPASWVVLEIQDLSGREVYKTALAPNRNRYQVNPGNLPEGLYVVSIKSREGVFHQSIHIQP